VKRQIASIIRTVGKWLICQADKMTSGTECISIVIDQSKRHAMLQQIEIESNLDAIREAGRKARQERAKQMLGAI
jgi:hypothetical protein